MNTSLKLKIGMLAVLIVFSVLAIVPSFYPDAPGWWKKYLAPDGLKLGLDLQGGIHLVLRVDLDKAVENSLELAAGDLKEVLAEKDITVVRMDSANPYQVVYTLPNTRAIDTVREVVSGEYENLATRIDADEGTFPRIILELTP
jgi:SecD/SecF fusion protein